MSARVAHFKERPDRDVIERHYLTFAQCQCKHSRAEHTFIGCLVCMSEVGIACKQFRLRVNG